MHNSSWQVNPVIQKVSASSAAGRSRRDCSGGDIDDAQMPGRLFLETLFKTFNECQLGPVNLTGHGAHGVKIDAAHSRRTILIRGHAPRLNEVSYFSIHGQSRALIFFSGPVWNLFLCCHNDPSNTIRLIRIIFLTTVSRSLY